MGGKLWRMHLSKRLKEGKNKGCIQPDKKTTDRFYDSKSQKALKKNYKRKNYSDKLYTRKKG